MSSPTGNTESRNVTTANGSGETNKSLLEKKFEKNFEGLKSFVEGCGLPDDSPAGKLLDCYKSVEKYVNGNQTNEEKTQGLRDVNKKLMDLKKGISPVMSGAYGCCRVFIDRNLIKITPSKELTISDAGKEEIKSELARVGDNDFTKGLVKESEIDAAKTMNDCFQDIREWANGDDGIDPREVYLKLIDCETTARNTPALSRPHEFLERHLADALLHRWDV